MAVLGDGGATFFAATEKNLVFLLLFLFYRRATCPVVWIELARVV